MNTSELISALRIKGSFPTSDDLFTNSDLLVLLNMAMDTDINPMMMKLNDEYLLQTQDFTIQSGKLYRIPSRAISIRDIKLIDSAGSMRDLPRNFEEDRASNRSGYYIVRNSIELSDDISSGTLRVKFPARPNKLVLTSECAQISSIDTNTNQIEVISAPGTLSNGVLVDVIQNNAPFDLLTFDAPISNISGTTITLASLPDGLANGDWICLANQSPIPLAPPEMHTVLVQAGLVTALSSKKDKAFESEFQILEQMKSSVINMLDPRVNNSSAKMRSGVVYNYFTNRRY